MKVCKIHIPIRKFRSVKEVMGVLERLQELERCGAWSELRALTPSLLSAEHYGDSAIAYAYLAKAHIYTATGGEDWRTALSLAQMYHSHTEPDSILRLKALALLALVSVDMGRTSQAKTYARRFLNSPGCHELPQYPWVIRVLGFVHYQNRQFARSISPRLQALHMFQAAGNDHEATRTAIGLAWSYARCGKFAKALEALPQTDDSAYVHLIDGVLAFIYASTGKPQEAILRGKLSLAASRESFDYADAAEVALALAIAYRQLGMASSQWLSNATLYAARQSREVSALLLLSQRARGGDNPHEEASRGSGGYHPNSRFTTGVA